MFFRFFSLTFQNIQQFSKIKPEKKKKKLSLFVEMCTSNPQTTKGNEKHNTPNRNDTF